MRTQFFVPLIMAAGLGTAAGDCPMIAARRGAGALPQSGRWPACFSFSPPLPLRGQRCAGLGASSICMQKGAGGGDQPGKAQKKPRKRSQRAANNPFSMPMPVEGPGGGPVGKAKRRMLERIEEMESEQAAEWTGLKTQLQQERVEGVWAADNPILVEKRKRWNEDLTNPGMMDDPQGENAVDVMGTNDEKWKQVRDVNTGDVYFWNIVTDETVWDTPEGIVLEEKLSPFRGVTKTMMDPGGAAGVKWLCTQTTTGHAHFGVFFQVTAKDSDVYITGIRTGSHYRSNIYEATYRVLVRDGSCYGNELSKAGWRQVGQKQVKAQVTRWGPKKWDKWGLTRFQKSAVDSQSACLPGITYEDRDPETIYGALPLAEAIHLKAGETKSICVWSNDMLGIVFRKRDAWMKKDDRKVRRHVGGFFDKGEVTDENADFVLKSGLIPCQDLFRRVVNEKGYAAFVGVLEYVLDEQQVDKGKFVALPENADAEFEEELKFFENAATPNKVLDDGALPLYENAEREVYTGPNVPAPATPNRESIVREPVKAAGNKGRVVMEMEDEEEEEEEEEEVDMAALISGPAENIFSGKGDKDKARASSDSDGGLLTLGLFMGDLDLGDLGCDADTTWEEVLQGVTDLADGAAVSLQYPHPDGMYVYVCICMCMYIYVCICIYTYMHADIHTYIHTYVHIGTRVCNLYQLYIHTHIHMYACMHTYIHIGTRVCKLQDTESWTQLLTLAADPDWDLDGFMEVEVIKKSK